MVAEVWNLQGGTRNHDLRNAVVAGPDGSWIFFGYTHDNWRGGSAGSKDWVATKLDPDGDVQWWWQGGTAGPEQIHGAAVGDNGSVAMIGYGGDWPHAVAAVMLDQDGDFLWEWQGGSSFHDVANAVAVSGDGSVVLGGSTTNMWGDPLGGSSDFTAHKLDAEGMLLWTWQNGTIANEEILTAAVGGDDNSVVMAGYSHGTWSGAVAGDAWAGSDKDADFAAVKLDADGKELWRWQSGTVVADIVFASATGQDGSTVLVGSTEGSWKVGHAGGQNDFAAVKLDADGGEIWRWQDGTTGNDVVTAVTAERDGSVFLAGSTNGSWDGPNNGSYVFAAVKLNVNGIEVWRWQGGSTGDAGFVTGAIATRPDDSVVLAGVTEGSWIGTNTIVDFFPPRVLATNGTDTNGTDNGTDNTSSPTSSDSSGTSIIIGVVFAVVAVVGAIIAGVRVRKRLIAKQKTGGAAGDIRPSDVPRVVERPRLTSTNRPIPSVGDLPASDAPCVVERPRFPSMNRPMPSVGDPSTPDVRRVGEKSRLSPKKRTIPSTGDLRAPSGGYDVAKAILEAAHKIAQKSQFPGVCEAAMLVSTLVNMISDGRSSSADVDARLKKCRLLITMLERASTVLGKIDNVEDNDTSREMKGIMIDNVQGAIGDLVDLIKTFRSKNKITQVVVSTLFKRRMDETQAVINDAFSELMMWLHIDTALNREDRRNSGGNQNSLSATEEGRAEGLNRERQAAEAEMIASARRQRRRRNLDQVEIPEDQVTISEEVLGKGGFGAVYIADYNGRNAAAKVIKVDHEHLDGDFRTEISRSEADAKQQRASLLLELQAMIRLRSPYTVNVYGAITSQKDRLILVMELLTGGDLRSFLRNSEEQLPEVQARRLITDVCAGMAFLHSKNAVHGDIKSANVLLDGEGRGKIADFGTSKWAHHSDSTGLATYRTTAGTTAHVMSFAWASPEVLDAKGSTYASDVYSFGMVAWEVLSMQVPWADEAAPLNIYKRVVFKGERPTIPVEAPADIAAIVGACWAGVPRERPTSNEIMRRLKSHVAQT